MSEKGVDLDHMGLQHFKKRINLGSAEQGLLFRQEISLLWNKRILLGLWVSCQGLHIINIHNYKIHSYKICSNTAVSIVLFI